MIKEGDIIKLGREILLIKDIHIKRKNKKNIKINNNETKKDNNALPLSFHTQTSQSLNLNEDFNNFENNNNHLEEQNERINNETGSNDNIQKTSNNINDNKNKDLISCNESEKNSEMIKKNRKICRICYMEENDKKINPLIKPCKCSGSMKYIHYECLLHWLKTKVLVTNNSYCENGFYTTYLLNLIECELCKNHLPNYIKHKNKIYSLIDYDKFEKDQKKPKEKNDTNNINNDNYIIFDEVTPGKQGNKYRFLVKFDENNIIKIGRGLEMQLILNDISVSRNHCQLKIDEDENIILEDSNSKFGTLVLIQAESIEILKGKTLTVQVGTNYLNIKMGIPKNIFGCCGVEEIDERNSYEKINYNSIKYDKKNEILNESITPENSDNEENKENNNQKEELIDKENEDNKNQNIEVNANTNENEKEKTNDNRNNKNNNLINNISTLKIETNINKNIPNNIQIIKKKIEAINSKEKSTVGASTTIKIEDNKDNKNNKVKKENIIVSENEKEEENKNSKVSDNNNNESDNDSDSDSEESSEDNYSSSD